MSSEPLLSNPQADRPGEFDSSADSTTHNVLASPVPTKRAPSKSSWVWALTPWIIGVPLGLLVPRYSALPPPMDTISAVVGWIYFAAWSISFYPQLYTNFKRKSVEGLSLDFQVLNALGFVCYAIYNCALYYDPSVRKQYARVHDGQYPAVHSNDVFFSLHALAATLITLIQCAVYERNGAKPAKASVVSVALLSTIASVWAAVIMAYPQVDPEPCSHHPHCPQYFLNWLTWLYFLSYIKLAITLIKYLPQVILNCTRRSTVGWNVWNVLLDFEGGILSLVQQMMDSITCSDWSAITGNPVKFSLGFVSMVFDVVFMVQHFCLFPDDRKRIAEAAMEADLENCRLVLPPGEASENEDGGGEGSSGGKKERKALLKVETEQDRLLRQCLIIK